MTRGRKFLPSLVFTIATGPKAVLVEDIDFNRLSPETVPRCILQLRQGHTNVAQAKKSVAGSKSLCNEGKGNDFDLLVKTVLLLPVKFRREAIEGFSGQTLPLESG
jgi:hypothetical protein